MALLPTPLTPDCEREVTHLIEHLPETALAPLLSTDPAFQTGGFRAEAKPAVLRQRIRQIVLGATPVSDALRTALAKRSRAALLVRQLTPDSLTTLRHALATLFTPQSLLVGMMLDPRQDVRTLAATWMPQPFATLEAPLAQQQVSEHFSLLLTLTGAQGASAKESAITPERWREQKNQLELTIHELREENRRLKGVDDRLSSVVQQLKKCQSQQADEQRKMEQLENALRQKNSALDLVQAKLARETANRSQRVKAAVDLALATEFHGWLAQARTIEAQATADDHSSTVLEHAERALENQASIDRQYGNVHTLRQRLANLENMAERIDLALRQSIRQSPELMRIAATLNDEIQAVRNVLDPAPALSPLEHDLIRQVHTLAEGDLHALVDLPDRLASLHVLSAESAARIAAEIRRRCAALDVREIPLPEAMTQQKAPTSLLARALAGQIPALLLIDGHNTIFGLPARYHPTRGASATESEKRQKMIKDVVRITAASPALRTSIVFDGPTHKEEQAAPNVRITYSGGSGEHRADAVLLDMIRFFAEADPEMTLLLVTNDNDLRKEAHRLGAQTIPVLELGAFF